MAGLPKKNTGNIICYKQTKRFASQTHVDVTKAIQLMLTLSVFESSATMYLSPFLGSSKQFRACLQIRENVSCV